MVFRQDPAALWGTGFSPAETETNGSAPAWEHHDSAAPLESTPLGDDTFSNEPVDTFETVQTFESADIFAGIADGSAFGGRGG